MKKIALLLVAALAVTGILAACSSSSTTTTAASAETEAQAAGTVGGWTINDDETVGYLPEDVQADFDKATEGLTGVGYTPVAYLGSQVVSGVNEMILCKGTTVTAEPQTALYVMTIYKDTSGNVEILNIVDFDLGKIKEQEDTTTEAGLAGGWTVNSDIAVPNMPADVQKAFDSATEGLTGATYQPMAYLGSQVVSGTNYAVLCHQTLTDANATENICVMYLYTDPSGNSSIDAIKVLNLADFNK